MKRILTVAVLLAVAAMSVGLYWTELGVRDLKREQVRLQDELVRERDAIRVLRAEWSYLNRPERLQALAARYLHLVPSIASQVATVDAVPLRTPVAGGRVLTPSETPEDVGREVWPRADGPLPLPASKPRQPGRSVILAAHEVRDDG
jgi:hypothetical protein